MIERREFIGFFASLATSAILPFRAKAETWPKLLSEQSWIEPHPKSPWTPVELWRAMYDCSTSAPHPGRIVRSLDLFPKIDQWDVLLERKLSMNGNIVTATMKYVRSRYCAWEPRS